VDLVDLREQARHRGWAPGSGTIEEVRDAARSRGWSEVPLRLGGSSVDTLRPTGSSQARRRSLSGQYGLGKQPLHTDGAHLTEPPDVVVLGANAPSRTPTLVCTIRASGADLPSEALRHGIFLVENGIKSFLSTAEYGSGIRYDPGCMTAADQRSRVVARFFDHLASYATPHNWVGGDQVLVIDNRLCVHARAGVDGAASGRELRRVAFRAESASS
jgi:alpha-ketoglutarate-dependent taurine dioxygenase